jgi:hypothetical protein
MDKLDRKVEEAYVEVSVSDPSSSNLALVVHVYV